MADRVELIQIAISAIFTLRAASPSKMLFAFCRTQSDFSAPTLTTIKQKPATRAGFHFMAVLRVSAAQLSDNILINFPDNSRNTGYF